MSHGERGGFFYSLAQDLWHGMAWKIAAIGARVWFLFVVFPFLPEGSLGTYVYLVSVGMIMGRALSFGLEEQLPLHIGSNVESAREFVPVYALVIALVLQMVVLSSFVNSEAILLVFLSLCYASHNLLAGVVRSIKPACFEVLGNLHAIVFSVFATLPLTFSGEELAKIAGASLLVSQFAVLQLMGTGFSEVRNRPLRLPHLIKQARGGAAKLWSNLSLITSLRGIVIWPKLLFGQTASDTIGFGLAVGEALWQAGMVIVNRTYSRLCRIGVTESAAKVEIYGRGALVLVGFCAAALCIAILPPLFSVMPRLNWQHVGVLTAMYGPVCVLLLIRYMIWAGNGSGKEISLVLGGWFASQGIAFAILPESFWVWAVLLGAVSSFVLAIPIAQRFFTSR